MRAWLELWLKNDIQAYKVLQELYCYHMLCTLYCLFTAGQLNGVDVSNLLCDTNDEIEEFMRKFGCEDLLTWKESKSEQAAEDVFADLYRVRIMENKIL